jgi:hypothetical protein
MRVSPSEAIAEVSSSVECSAQRIWCDRGCDVSFKYISSVSCHSEDCRVAKSILRFLAWMPRREVLARDA